MARDDDSIQHLHEFMRYAQTTSWWRVSAVCFFTMMLPFALAMLMELLPLRPPSEGCLANWMLWIRFFASSYCVSLSISAQFKVLVPTAPLTQLRLALVSFVASCAHVLTMILVSWAWVFPAPFVIFLCAPAWHGAFIVAGLAAIGQNALRHHPELKQQLQFLVVLVNAESLAMVVYPVYTAAYIALSGLAQSAFVLVLLCIKQVLKALLRWVSQDTSTAQVIVMTSVDLFEALYLFKCMQMASSTFSAFALVLFDLGNMAWHVRKLHVMISRVRRVQVYGTSGSVPRARTDILAHVQRYRSHPNSMSMVTVVPVDTVDESENEASDSEASSQSAKANDPVMMTNTGVNAEAGASRKTAIRSEQIPKRVAMDHSDRHVWQFVLTCKELMLIEFIECAVPFFYVLYVLLLYHLPNAQFYPEMVNMTATRMRSLVLNIAVYTLMEFGTLVYLHLLMLWRFRISGLHLLAFTLETEYQMLLGVFVGWVIIVLQFTLQHGGADLSLKFSWIK